MSELVNSPVLTGTPAPMSAAATRGARTAPAPMRPGPGGDQSPGPTDPRGNRSRNTAVSRPQPPDGDAMAADGSTFAPALALLPDPLRADVHRLYCVLRTLDDLVDEDDPRAAPRLAAVETWARDQAADTPETRALADLARRHPLPRASLLEFCQGMRHDIARARIETDADFMRYCQRAGGSVGVVLASMLGAGCDGADAAGGGAEAERKRRTDAERRMAALGRAMQVTNILRDIDEDLEHGRVYISEAAIERFGFPEPGAREALLRDHIARADALYEEGLQAIPLLASGRRAMVLAASLYREILRQIEREGYGARPGRAVVPAWRVHALTAGHRPSQPQPRGRAMC